MTSGVKSATFSEGFPSLKGGGPMSKIRHGGRRNQLQEGPTLVQRGAAVLRLLAIYARQRAQCCEIQKSRRRVPAGMSSQLRLMEQEGAQLIAPLNPLFFQRFAPEQLERMVTTMPILKLSKNRLIFGAGVDPETRAAPGSVFLLLAGA